MSILYDGLLMLRLLAYRSPTQCSWHNLYCSISLVYF